MSSITFDQIPDSIRKPGIYSEFDTKSAQRSIPQNKQKVLIIAQMTSSGLASALTPEQIYSDSQAASRFGDGSIAHLMAVAALKTNKYIDLTVIAQEDAAAGMAATGTITITGPATAAGVVTLYIGTKKISVAVASGDAATAIASALKAAIDDTAGLPVTASVTDAVITLTAKNKGTCGNEIPLGYTLTNVTGVTVAIVAMATGATDPDIDAALAVVYGTRYHIICTSYNDATSLAALGTHLDSVSDAVEKRGAIGVYALTGALASATTLAGTINSGRIMGAYLRQTTATARKAASYQLAAAVAAMRAYEEDPGLSIKGLALTGIPAPNIADRLSRTEQETCLYGGVAPCEVIPGEKVTVVRDISTYTVNESGISDTTLLDITTIMALDYVRQAMLESDATRFARVKKSTRVKNSINSNHIAVAKVLETAEIVQNVDDHKDEFYWEDDAKDVTRVNFAIPASIIPNLHILAQKITLILE
jgi:phage tail sheath gpL-like